MTQGRSIRLFLVDGAPNGQLTAGIMNWTDHIFTLGPAVGSVNWFSNQSVDVPA